jgi:hypothetical protein
MPDRKGTTMTDDLTLYAANLETWLAAHVADPAPNEPSAATPAARSLFDLLDARDPADLSAPPVMPRTSDLCPSCGGTGENNLQRDGRGDGTPCRLCSDPEDNTPTELPAPWRMSIEDLDTWHDRYAARADATPGLSNTERRHRAEIDRNIHLRHEARRHASFP